MHGYLNQVSHGTTPSGYPTREPETRAVEPPRTADLVVSALLWFLPATLAAMSTVLAPWFLMAGGICASKPECRVDTSAGVWIMVGGGIVGFALGAALSVLAARQGRAMFPGALVGAVLVLLAWFAASFLMG
ncbi:hypothetical protein ACWEPH_30785 [Nocardia beijingensis]|uniref:DUF4190 domain-containing protein n=1 Tax=Nocardia beijingensis TaxID=95162 RepID=A0ABW7WEK6_9NOCA|nr:hypothetical protein [Nocardia beijingensis]MBF6079285.1 hypothetical protein [Nocardia beijingensis]